jgi:hypothetical protein
VDQQDIGFIGILMLSLCGVGYIWREQLGWLMQRLLQPVQRLHSKWSRQNQRGMMAKWRKGHLANVFYETIHAEIEAGRISPQQGKQLQSKMATFFGVDDLARIKTHEDAIKHRLMLNKIHEVGPAQAKPAWGGKPGEDVVPQYGVLGSKFLKRRKT